MERICAAASELLNESDEGTPTVDQIAARAQVSVGSFYHFAPTKEALYLELRRRFFEETKRRVNTALSSNAIETLDNFFDALTGTLSDLFELTRAHRGLYRVIASSAHASPEFALEVLRQDQPTLDLMASVIRQFERRLRPSDPDKTARLIFLLVEGVLSNWVRHPLSSEETATLIDGSARFISHLLFRDEDLAGTKRFGNQ